VRLKKPIETLLTRERICRVATTGRNGVPQVVPVCHLVVDGKIYFASGGKARKVAHLRINPHAAITVDLYAEDWSNLKGVMVQGTTALIERGPRWKKIRRLLYEKYPQYPEEAALGKGDVIVEVTPRHVFSWGLE
jgi:nitroimidazol reductase NimA-like FMN-containing flavoprotein (pyridoxamine 5'-phosphate oxidase superfamily)